jgi:anti-sigma factor RsiW
LGRDFDKHIDNEQLSALVSSEIGQKLHGLSPRALAEAERHVQSCADCSTKVSKYRQVMNRFSSVAVSEIASPGVDCPEDVEWHEVAAGLWPELKTKQLIMHAALCDHCGPLLRAATSVDDDPTPEEEKLLEELKAPSRPVSIPQPAPPSQSSRRLIRWLVPALAVAVIAFLATMWKPSSSASLSGQKFAEFAVNAYKQQAQGNVALDIRSDSPQALNDWLNANAPFKIALPVSAALPGEERPYHLQGARLMRAGARIGVYIAYQMQSGPVCLMVVPDSVAVASGGVVAAFTKVSFHYQTVEGFKVVTWSLRGNTYALVSQEGNSTQRSCMVCHSAMRDRDLSQTPAPLHTQTVLQ